MKITGKKDLTVERLRGRAAVDAVMVPRINEAMGPKFALYQMKAMLAQTGYVMSVGDEADDILTRFSSTAKTVAILETERQALQARIDSAATAAEIDAIVAAL
ncbi:hypothetical protein [Phyllobacterium lublinensis]|uniref:hypothetical protein n=1 Tax=Phyllobacterium lublinensis TaxID=2875708 RepID=UPI001CCA248F|nr:hypothetical protein [Phyllobacterium sp. 2063]MBZ9653559.1 hypothetical protein [Phyllobacterium sp. 2063]